MPLAVCRKLEQHNVKFGFCFWNAKSTSDDMKHIPYHHHDDHLSDFHGMLVTKCLSGPTSLSQPGRSKCAFKWSKWLSIWNGIIESWFFNALPSGKGHYSGSTTLQIQPTQVWTHTLLHDGRHVLPCCQALEYRRAWWYEIVVFYIYHAK